MTRLLLALALGCGNHGSPNRPTPTPIDGPVIAEPGPTDSECDALIDHVSRRSRDPLDRTVDVLIGRLRRKLEPDPSRPRYVQTVYGVGYRFAEEQE